MIKKVNKMPLKRKIIIVLMLLASGLFLYQGFSMLFHEKSSSESLPLKKIDVKKI